MSTPSSGLNHLSLARFAFNIYGSLNDRSAPRTPDKPKPLLLQRLKYVCEREISCVSQLQHTFGRLLGHVESSPLASHQANHHVVLGGKNYLRLLVLGAGQTEIVADINMLETPPALTRLNAPLKLFNVNTLKTKVDVVACGLTSGSVCVYQVANNGKARLLHRFDGHKRVVNSLDFVDHEPVLVSGSQDGTIRLWDLRSQTSKPAVTLAATPAAMPTASHHSDPVRSCQWSPHLRVRGRMVVLSVHDSGALCKYDIRYPNSSHGAGAGVTLPERKWTFHTGPALSLHVHPELEYVLTGGRDRKICLWNYGDTPLNAMAPDIVLNTYGPVRKIRWNYNANGSPHDASRRLSSDAFQRLPSDAYDDLFPSRLALYAHDFACLYLNDDPSISVYNLARKHVPKEIVTTDSGKPFQNFIWATSGAGHRRLWTVNKLNAFVSYDLNCPADTVQNVMRPLDSLPPVATSWVKGSSGLSLVSQEPGDFDLLVPLNVDTGADHGRNGEFGEVAASDEGRSDDEKPLLGDFQPHHSSLAASADHSVSPVRAPLNSHPSTPTFFYLKTFALSPKDRPMLLRLSTQLSQPNISSSLGLQRSNLPELGFSQPLIRPPLQRNSSQNTMESVSLGSAVFQPILNHTQSPNHHFGYATKQPQHQMTHSPFVVSMALPVPAADDTVFAALASDYLTGIPDAFTLSFVCQINARVAASVSRFRDCQTWRILSVALDQQELTLSGASPVANQQNVLQGEKEAQDHTSLDVISKSPDDVKSISSELGNLVGSFNSDSTLTTNYGNAPRKRSNTSINNLSILSSSRDSPPPRSPFPVMVSCSNSHICKQPMPIFPQPMSEIEKTNETGPVSEDKTLITPDAPTNADESAKSSEQAASKSPNKLAPKQGSSFLAVSGAARDLDDENLNILNTASASLSSSALSVGTDAEAGSHYRTYSLGSKEFQVGSWQSLGSKPFPLLARGSVPPHDSKHLLDRVDESSIVSKDNQMSQLTKAMSNYMREEALFKPWHAINVVKRSLEYALAQGDVVMSATLILLFYDFFQVHYNEDILEPQNSLEVLGLYIETLRARELYTVAVQVVKDCPLALKERLSAYAVKEVEMCFYCCWCKTLLTNEMSKQKYGVGNDKFGFWYCDECSRKQLNCVYCNEPCKGLTVVESLRCGHRGHFGCFQEWHVDNGNVECPGGCE